MPDRIVLLGGPFDGAEGCHRHAGQTEIFVRHGDEFHLGGENGLFIAATHCHPAQHRYVLTSRADEGRFIYSYGEGSGSLEYLSREEALAA